MSYADLEQRVTRIEGRLDEMHNQTVAMTYVADEAKRTSETAREFYTLIVKDIKGIREQQKVHTSLFEHQTKILDHVATTVAGHTRILEEHSKKFDEHSAKLD
ncbi:hypothetical protein, partial [Sphaerisporangium siamense]